jgi:signal transduction histidine kinase
MDIEVIIKRTLVFAGLVGAVVAVVSLMAFVSQGVLAHFIQIPEWLSNVLAAAIIAGVYGPLRNWLVNTTDRYLFQKRYDYKELLKKFTDDVMVMVDLRQLVQMTVSTLSDTIKLEHCSLFLWDRDTHVYGVAAARGVDSQSITLEEQEPFITFLREAHEPIGADGRIRFPEAVTRRLTECHARLALPLSIHEDLIGVLCLGQKKSDEAFTKDDLDILLPLARTLAIAVSNAQLVEDLLQTNEQLKTATERLLVQERMAAAGQIASGMAHEIKNPLAAIKIFSEFLPDKYDDPVFREKFFRIVPAEIQRINHIVQELSMFARPSPLQLQPLRLTPLIEDTLSLLSNQCLQQGVTVHAAFHDDGAVVVQADPQQLKQVLLNLLLNSLEAMAQGGRLEVGTSVEGPRLMLRIADTGSGISPELQRRVWDPFFTTKARGMGLGLAIVKGIVERHGGAIALSSAPGQGTTVQLHLPTASIPP